MLACYQQPARADLLLRVHQNVAPAVLGELEFKDEVVLDLSFSDGDALEGTDLVTFLDVGLDELLPLYHLDHRFALDPCQERQLGTLRSDDAELGRLLLNLLAHL